MADGQEHREPFLLLPKFSSCHEQMLLRLFHACSQFSEYGNRCCGQSSSRFLVAFGEETLSTSSLSHAGNEHLKYFYILLEPELLMPLQVDQVGENITVESYFQRKMFGFSSLGKDQAEGRQLGTASRGSTHTSPGLRISPRRPLRESSGHPFLPWPRRSRLHTAQGP